MPPRSSSSSSSRPPGRRRRAASSTGGQAEARPRGRPRAVPRTGRIRRHRVRRLPGAAWPSDRPGRAGTRAGPPRRRPAHPGRRGGPDGRRGACRGTGDRVHLDRGGCPGETARSRPSGRCCPGTSRSDRCARVAADFSPRRAAIAAGVPLHHLERAAQPAARALRPRAPGAPRRRGHAGRRQTSWSGGMTSRRSGVPQDTAVRTLHEVRVRRQGHLVTIDVIGDAFLRQMVRSIVAALLRIGHRDGRPRRTWRAALRSPGTSLRRSGRPAARAVPAAGDDRSTDQRRLETATKERQGR